MKHAKKTTRHGEPELDEKQAAATDAVEGNNDVPGDENAEGSGFMGSVKNAAAKAKHALGLDKDGNTVDDESDVKRPGLTGKKKEPLKYPNAEENNQARIVHSEDTTDEVEVTEEERI